MSDEKRPLYIPGVCPYCGAPVSVTEDQKTVICPVCDRVYPASRLFSGSVEPATESFADLAKAEEELELSEAREAEEARQQELCERLAESGVDAEEIYDRVLRSEEKGELSGVILNLLGYIRGYRDVDKRITKLTSVFYFGNRYLEVAGRRYYTRQEHLYSFGPTFALYEIKDGIPAKSPVLTGVSKIIRAFGSYIYFLRADKYLCIFDVEKKGGANRVTILDSGNAGDFLVKEDEDVYLSEDGKTFYYRKKLPIEWKKTGCFAWFFSLFRKKPVGVQNKFNNYSLMAVNMAEQSCTAVLPEFVSLTDVLGESFFYTVMPKKFEYDMEFRVYNAKTGEDKKLLNADCMIHHVEDNQIIFSLQMPNEHNLNLYAMDLAGREAVLLERNVYDYYGKEDDRVYYTVGNGEDFHLLSVKTDGTLRRKVLAHATELVELSEGYVYYVKTVGDERYLMKVDVEGKQHTLLASHFASLIRKGFGYLYYLTENAEIHRVLLSGKDDAVMARDVCTEKIIATRKNIFFCAHDTFDGDVLSLYRLITPTGVIRKVAYQVADFCEYDPDTVFFSRTERRLYEIPTMDPRDEVFYKEKFRSKKLVTADIIKFCKYDKETGMIEDVLTIGIPSETGARLLPKTSFYARDGISARGEIYSAVRAAAPNEAMEESERRLAMRDAKKQRKFERRKMRADRRAKRRIRRAKRRGRYPSAPRFYTYDNALAVSQLPKQRKNMEAGRFDDLNGKS